MFPMLIPMISSFATAGAQVGTTLAGASRMTGELKVRATQIVDAHEAAMKANLDAYRAGARSQDEALAEYDRLWQSMTAKLGQLGAIGQRSIAERSPDGVYPYRRWYRDPIAGVVEQPIEAYTGPVYDVGARFSVTHTEPAPLPPAPAPAGERWWLVVAGLALVAVVAAKKKRGK